MQPTQENIDAAVQAYNSVTSAHKRAPVEKYVKKQLSAGETVEIVSGHPRWSSALRFSADSDGMSVEFVVNPALPGSMQKLIAPMKERFDALLSDMEGS